MMYAVGGALAMLLLALVFYGLIRAKDKHMSGGPL